MKWDVQEAAASTYPEWAWVDGAVIGLKKHFGKGLSRHVYIGKKGHGLEFYAHDELVSLGEYLIHRLKDKQLKDYIERNWILCKRKMDILFSLISKSDLADLPTSELRDIFTNLNECYSEYYGLMMFPEPTEIVMDERFKQMLETSPDIKKHASILITPSRMSFLQKEKLSIINLLESLDKQERQQIFAKDIIEIKKKISKNTALSKTLQAHIDNFAWLRANYLEAPRISIEDVLERAKELAPLDLSSEKKKIEGFESSIKKQKIKIIKGLSLNKEFENLLEISDFIGSLHDERKEYTLRWVYHAFIVLNAICNRFGQDPEKVKFLPKEDILSLLETGKIDKKKAKECYQAYAYIRTEKEKIELYGKKALAYERRFKEKEEEILTIMHGIGVSPGKAIGTAKVVYLKKDFDKFKDGDILIAPMTRPEFVPLMTKASAIVTDQGGITSHASIVSRELGIPCIVGTKNATKRVKDNDILEVNADHGLITVIR